MTPSDDPIKVIARWKPRPSSLRCVRRSGDIETYAVGAGRRAWTALRKLLAPDTVEILGLVDAGAGDPAIVGRWTAPGAELAEEDGDVDIREPDVDDPPSREAALFRWVAREMRGIYGDQLRFNREMFAIVSDALKVQREMIATLPRAPMYTPPSDEEDDGFAKVRSLMSDALQIMAMQRGQASGPGPEPVEPAPAPAPPRDSG